ncbi:MAG: hypothetical protein Q9199_003917 [Rusavskia elegans]
MTLWTSPYGCSTTYSPTLLRRNTYEHFTARSPDLQLAIFDLYREFVRLGLRVMKTLGSGRVKKVDLEVGVASNERWERRYEEILDTRMPPAIEGVPLTSRNLEQSHNIFSIPYPQNAKFYGRQAVVDEIHQHLSHDRTTSSALKFVALCGLGGSGKTQLALEYAYKYRESYDACIWISCDTTIKAAQGFTDVARKLEVETAQQQQLMAVVKDWLCDSCENWLIIFDAEDRKIVADLWPPTAHESFLLTSQHQHWASADNLTRMMSIESFTHAKGVGMLQDILQDQEGGGIPTNAAERIVSIVGALPLAIFQLGSYLEATNSSPEEFIRRYQKPSKAARIDSWDEATPLTYQHTLAKLWKLALERLPPDSMLFLDIFSFLDSDTVPDVLFLGAPEGSHFNNFDL